MSSNNAKLEKTIVRCDVIGNSLVDRLDRVVCATSRSKTPLSISRATHTPIPLSSPLFTRIACDSTLDEAARAQLLLELVHLDVAWVGHRDTHWQKLEGMLAQRNIQRFAPLHFDQSIDQDDFENATAIELQLYGVPFAKPHKASVAYWAPQLPVELFRMEHLGKKVEAMRAMTIDHTAIGAALSSTSVYDDIRYLSDSGMDYVCLLADVTIDPANLARLGLSPLHSSVEMALKAVSDAGTGMKVLLAANLQTTEEMHSLLRTGITGVCMDAYLSSHQHTQVGQPKEAFSQFLSYANQSVSPYSWVKTVVSDLIQQLTDWDTYYGI